MNIRRVRTALDVSRERCSGRPRRRDISLRRRGPAWWPVDAAPRADPVATSKRHRRRSAYATARLTVTMRREVPSVNDQRAFFPAHRCPAGAASPSSAGSIGIRIPAQGLRRVLGPRLITSTKSTMARGGTTASCRRREVVPSTVTLRMTAALDPARLEAWLGASTRPRGFSSSGGRMTEAELDWLPPTELAAASRPPPRARSELLYSASRRSAAEENHRSRYERRVGG